MNTLFREFENENAQRTYPFASGCTVTDTGGNAIGAGILVDAALYPVNPEGNLYLSGITESGEVLVSDDTGVIMSGVLEQGSDVIELYGTSGLRRHSGTLVAASTEAAAVLVNAAHDRKFKRASTLFSASCVFTVVNGGVLGIDAGTGIRDGLVAFANGPDDDVRVSSTGSDLVFDALPRPDTSIGESIREIYCVVDGRTPFRIQKIADNTVNVYLDNIERSDVCGNAHREDSLVMVDTCDCGSSSPDDSEPVEIPEVFQSEAVDVFGQPNCDSAFYLTVANMLGYDNPLSLTLTDGESVPPVELEIENDAYGRRVKENTLTNNLTPKGAVLQVPGLKKE